MNQRDEIAALKHSLEMANAQVERMNRVSRAFIALKAIAQGDRFPTLGDDAPDDALIIAAALQVGREARQELSGRKAYQINALLHGLELMTNGEAKYPADMFPEPDWLQVGLFLQAGGISLDQVSGSIRREVFTVISDQARNVIRAASQPAGLAEGEG